MFSFLFAVLSVVEISYSAKFPETTKVSSYFESMKTKPEPLFYCLGYEDGMHFKLPEIPTCDLPKKVDSSSVVSTTFYWEDISKQSIDAHECYGVEQKLETSFKFYIREYWEKKSPEKTLHVSQSECREMVMKQIAPNKERIVPIHEGVQGTQNVDEPEKSWAAWFATAYATRTNYFVVDVKMTISNDKNQNVYASTNLKGKCVITEGTCETERGVLVWDKGDYKACRMMLGKTTPCLHTDDMMTCPDVHMSLTAITSIEMCGATVGVSQQGVFFTTEKANEVLNGIMSTQQATDVMNLEKPRKRNKRDTRIWTDIEDAARTQFLWDMIKNISESNVVMFHDYTCKNNQIFMNFILRRAESGEASIVARTFLHDSSYRARMEGDIIVLWKCEEVRNYYFLENVNCTVEYPVRFTLFHQRMEGFMRAKTHEIVDYPTKGECPAKPFYFNANGTIILLNSKEQIHGMETLPQPFSMGKEDHIPDLSFRASGFYKAQDVLGDDTPYEFMKMQLNGGRRHVDDVIAKYQKGERLDEDEQKVFDGLFGISLEPIMNYLKCIGEFLLFGLIVIAGIAAIALGISCCLPACSLTSSYCGMCSDFADSCRQSSFMSRMRRTIQKQSDHLQMRPLPPTPSAPALPCHLSVEVERDPPFNPQQNTGKGELYPSINMYK